MEHDFTTVDLGTNAKFIQSLCGRCTCGHLTDVVTDRNKLDDVIQDHHRTVKREALGLGVRRPSLSTVLKHYDRMAAHPASTVTERSQWSTLAEEVRERIVQTSIDDTIGQDALFDLQEET